MSASSLRRWARIVADLTCLVLVLAVAAEARASEVTYNIVNYPVNEADTISGGIDTISGTIVTNGTIGHITDANIIGGTFSFTSSRGSVSEPASFYSPVGLEATATDLLLDPGTQSSLIIDSARNGTTNYQAAVTYDNYTTGDKYIGYLASSPLTPPINPPIAVLLAGFDASPVPMTPGSIGANSSWVIATVPEPGTFVLLFPVMLAIGAVGLPGHIAHTKHFASAYLRGGAAPTKPQVMQWMAAISGGCVKSSVGQ